MNRNSVIKAADLHFGWVAQMVGNEASTNFFDGVLVMKVRVPLQIWNKLNWNLVTLSGEWLMAKAGIEYMEELEVRPLCKLPFNIIELDSEVDNDE